MRSRAHLHLSFWLFDLFVSPHFFWKILAQTQKERKQERPAHSQKKSSTPMIALAKHSLSEGMALGHNQSCGEGRSANHTCHITTTVALDLQHPPCHPGHLKEAYCATPLWRTLPPIRLCFLIAQGIIFPHCAWGRATDHQRQKDQRKIIYQPPRRERVHEQNAQTQESS